MLTDAPATPPASTRHFLLSTAVTEVYAHPEAARPELVVAGVGDGVVHSRVELPSVCTGLAAGPDGELAVATRNDVILLDVPAAAMP